MILFIRLYKNSKIPVFGPKVWSVVLGFGYFGYFLFLDMKRAVSQNLYGNDGSGKITLKRAVSQNLKSTTIKNRFGKYALSLIHARRENRFYSLSAAAIRGSHFEEIAENDGENGHPDNKVIMPELPMQSPFKSPQCQLKLVPLLLHAADISNPAKP